MTMGWDLWGGLSPPQWEWGLERGLSPIPENFWNFSLEMVHFGAFHACIIA